MKLAPVGGATWLSGWMSAVATVTGWVTDAVPAVLQEPMHWQVWEWPVSAGAWSWC